jgi:hypothetical protein
MRESETVKCKKVFSMLKRQASEVTCSNLKEEMQKSKAAVRGCDQNYFLQFQLYFYIV